jgi:hypothetical protein
MGECFDTNYVFTASKKSASNEKEDAEADLSPTI